MRVLPALLLLSLLPAGVSAAAAQPRSIGDCEKVKGDLAYNQCLASFGPPARAGAARSQGGETDAGDQAAEPEPQSSGSSRRESALEARQAGTAPIRRRGGRQSMSFDVVGSRSEAASGRTRLVIEPRSNRRR
jgi:hypothetical protein